MNQKFVTMKTHVSAYIFVLLALIMLPFAGSAQERDLRIFNDSVVEISQIGTNTIRSDFGPFVVRDSLYFTTYSDKVLGQTDKKLRANAFYDLYKAGIDAKGNTTSKREPVPEFLTKFHDGPVAWCAKTGELFVTQSNNIAESESSILMTHEKVKLRIVIAKQLNGKWESITEFPYNDPVYSVGHPAITESGDTLVFSSDRIGGFGETDLYYSIRKDGKWGNPVNMGPQINTSGKEEFAFITNRYFGASYLIFASNGRFGLGGLDLYYTQFPGPNYKVEHFMSPINSSADDFAMMIPPNVEYGYLTSNRPGTGSDDIYKFTFKRIKRSCERELYAFDSSSLRAVPGVRMKFCDQNMFLTDQLGKLTNMPKLNTDCEIVASTFGYYDSKKLLTSNSNDCEAIRRDTIWLDPILGKKIILHNIYYDLDKWNILPEAARELDKLVSFMNANPELTVELSSHTDSRASDKYNQILSQRRAESAVNYVVSKGIDPDRISGRGYGETQLLNKCADGVDCTPEEHRQNRRTEIFIPDFGRAKNVKQTLGDYSDSLPVKSRNQKQVK